MLMLKSLFTRVQHLLASCGPAHVFWPVMGIVVDPIHRQFRFWTGANVGVKVHKTGTPSFADLNASSAVVPVFGVVGVMTALNHLAPQRVFGRFAHAVCSIGMMTSARGRHTAAQIADEYFLLFSADTSAEQIPLRRHLVRMLAATCHLSSWGFRDDCPITNDSS